MKTLVVIPARIGSKSVPKKNIKLLKNKPLINYTIEYALNSNLPDKIVVSTDSEEIANIARKAGAEVPFIRPKELAEDNVRDFPVAYHAITTIEKISSENYDYLVWLRPTSPFRPKNLIERCIEILNNNPDATSVRAVTPSSEHPYRQWTKDGRFIVGFDAKEEVYNWPRQELPQMYFQTGDIEVIRRETILSGSISGNKVMPVLIDNEEYLDIDNESDWKKAENHRS